MFQAARTPLIRSLAIAGLAALPAAGPAQAAPVDFVGKTIEIIVPYTEGGGTDVYVRLFTPFLHKYLPGQPTVVIRNFPGGASIMGSNRFEARAKPDGLTILSTSSSTSVAQLMGGSQREFDVLKWRQIIETSLGTIVYFSPRTGVTGKDVAADIKMLEANKTPLLYGAKQPNASELRILMALDFLGLKFNAIFGVARGEVREAILRGEMQVNDDTTGAFLDRDMPYVKRGELIPMFTFGYIDGEKLVRDPLFPNLPSIGELYEQVNGKPPSGEIWEAIKSFIYLAQIAAKGFALPTGTPDDIVNAYVEAARNTLADPDFKKRAIEEIGDYPSRLGPDADQAIQHAVNLRPEVKAWLATYLQSKFNVKM